VSRRVSIADLMPADEPVSPIVVIPGDTTSPEPASSAVPTTRRRAPKVVEAPPPLPEQVPKYLRLDRTEARLYPDQVDALDAIAKRLNRARARRGHRITANDLLRVAVDLLLTREGDLFGYTEGDLMAAVGLAARESQRP
jgi:hypothetical protein